MSSSRFLRTLIRVVFITLFCVAFLGLSSFWAVSQRATTRFDYAARRNSSASLFLPDKGGVTPEANGIVVNSTADVINSSDGLCTLREAITAANNNAASGAVAGECAAGSSSADDMIDVSVTGAINLASALPNISSNMTINGPGASSLTVQRSAAGGTPAFAVLSVTNGTVTISGLTVSNGLANPSVGGGGGVRNSGVLLTLLNVTVTGNQTMNGLPGGGIFNSGGTLTVQNSTISGNASSASGDGGGIYNSGGTINLSNSTVSGNHAGDGVSPNGGGNGGGIWNIGTVVITNSTISGNQTGTGGAGGNGGFGGGLYNINKATLTNVTVSGNNTGGPSNSPGGGGGISNPGTLTLTNCTIANNQTGGGVPGATNGYGTGGGIANGGTTNLKNTIVSNNTVAGGAAGPDLFGTFVSNDYNLIGSTAGATFTGTTTHNILNQNPQLGTLINNGGPTMTHALLAGSPALDAGDDCVTQAAHCGDANVPQLNTDQRGAGFSRASDGNNDATATVDIGAFEAQKIVVTNTNDSGAGSLRQAILDANANPGADTITFNIPGAGVHTITPASLLPAITDQVLVDGYTQPGASRNTLASGENAVLLIELDGTVIGGSSGLTIRASNCEVRGLVINRFAQGIFITSSSGTTQTTVNLIQGNFIGTNASGNSSLPNSEGISIQFSNHDQIGGTTPDARNLIAGNAARGLISAAFPPRLRSREILSARMCPARRH